MAKRTVLVPDLRQMRRPPTHPGHTFEREFRKPSAMSQATAARKLALTPYGYRQFAAGRVDVNVARAKLLSVATGNSVGFWLNLQANLNDWLAIHGKKYLPN
jgi:plasmid maintenance system antidote protein VapI